MTNLGFRRPHPAHAVAVPADPAALTWQASGRYTPRYAVRMWASARIWPDRPDMVIAPDSST